MFNLDGKIALITGAAGGLGDKIARTLHAQGATLALTDMRAEPMEKLKAELGSRVECFTDGAYRHPCQQCRINPRQFVYAHERRRLAAGFGR